MGMYLLFADKNRTGDWSEHKAVTWLWEQGWEVFKNCGKTGSVDLIALKDGELRKIDVKTLTRRSDGELVFRTSGHDKILENGIVLLWVSKEGRVGWNRDYF